MNVSDIINGLFELVGACVIGANVYALYRDKEVKGVHWSGTFYFTAWGGWNLIFYPANGLWFSFLGGIAIVAVQLAWIALLVYYYNNRSISPSRRSNIKPQRRRDRQSTMWNTPYGENVYR